MWPTSAQGWLTLISSFLGIAATGSAMLGALLKRYRDTLKNATAKIEEASKLLQEQKAVNEAQAVAIEVSLKDRGEMKNQLEHLITAQQTLMQIEIDKIADKAHQRGKITSREKAHLTPLWEAYEKNDWNHIEKGKVTTALALPVIHETEGY